MVTIICSCSVMWKSYGADQLYVFILRHCKVSSYLVFWDIFLSNLNVVVL
jgi:hypothetical protein